MKEVKIEGSWGELLKGEFEKPYFNQLTEFVKKEYGSVKVYPPGSLIFNAFDSCPVDRVKVVILGQDPYHGAGQAHGLCFSVNDGIRHPPSLINIFKELKADIGKEIPVSGNLQKWADQGIFLLNATLTVKEGNPGSHQGKGWETFTDHVIHALSGTRKNIVFMLWGAYAQKKVELIDTSNHLILTAPHPSPFSADRGFFGCRHFSKANHYLKEHGIGTIDW